MKLPVSDLNNPQKLIQCEPFIEESIVQNPENPDAYIVKAAILLYKEEFDEALYYANKAIGFNPTNAGVYVTKAAVLSNMGYHEQAGESLKEGRNHSHDCPSLNWNYALWQLQNKNFAVGWNMYRWRKVHTPGHIRTLEPEWNFNIKNKHNSTLFVWGEQGLGDQIMFFRFLKQIKGTFGFKRIILECNPELYTLFYNNKNNVDDVIAHRSDFHIPFHYDYHCSLADLPYNLGICTEDDMDGKRRYLVADNKVRERFKQSFASLNTKGPKIGICWQGNPGHSNDKNRSAKLDDFEPLKQFGPLVALQKDVQCSVPEGMELMALHDGMINADYTAAIISELDVVVTIDSFIAHLAGALGKKTYLLLPYIHEWRWADGKGSSYLYEDVQLVKQTIRGSWKEPIETVINRIKDQYV